MEGLFLIMDDVFVLDVLDIVVKNGINIIVWDEVKIEMVIIILWVVGGVLFLILLILFVCILRNNKKIGVQCGIGQVFLFMYSVFCNFLFKQ